MACSLLGAFLCPPNANYKECELPWGCYCCSEYFLLACKTLGRAVSSCLLYLKTVTKTVVLRSPCSDRCESEGNISEGLQHTWVAHVLELVNHRSCQCWVSWEVSGIGAVKVETFLLQIELVTFYEKRKQKQMCWSSAETQSFGFPLLDMQLGE